MPFARWKDFDACVLEQQEIGHSAESSQTICGAIQARAEKGALYKANTSSFDILQKSDDELIVGGYATWELRDPENDVITTQAQVNFLKKFFALPKEYQNIMWKHKNIQIGTPLLSYTPPNGDTVYSHVNEKGTYLLAKIRNDPWRSIQAIRTKILNGTLAMYSIAGDPVNYDTQIEKGEVVHYHYDLDPFEVTMCEKGYNPKAYVQVLSKAKGLCAPCFDKWLRYYLEKGKPLAKAEELAAKLVIRHYTQPTPPPTTIHRSPNTNTSTVEQIFQKHWSQFIHET